MAYRPSQTLAIRSLFWLVLFSSVIALAATGMQTYVDYRLGCNKMVAAMDLAVGAHQRDLAGLAALGDRRALTDRLALIQKIPDVLEAAVLVDDRVVEKTGEQQEKKPYFLYYSLASSKGRDQGPASLRLDVDLNRQKKNAIERFLKSLAVNGFMVFCLGIFFFAVFQKLVTDHLESLARQVKAKDYRKPYQPIVLQRKGAIHDEFTKVVLQLNSLEQEVRKSIDGHQKKEQRLLSYLDASEEAIINLDLEGRCCYANSAAIELVGFDTLEDLVGKKLFTLLQMDDRGWFARLKKTYPQVGHFNLSQPGHLNNISVVNPKGIRHLLTLRSQPVYLKRQFSGTVIFFKKEPHPLAISHRSEMVVEAIRQLSCPFFIIDRDLLVVDCNDAALRQGGYLKQELIAKDLAKVLTLDDKETEGGEKIWSPFAKGQDWQGFAGFTHKGGESIRVYTIYSPLRDREKSLAGYVFLCLDVSTMLAKRSEEESGKVVDAMHRISANFAHEFGNPLFGVRSVIEDFLARLKLAAEDRQLLELAGAECQRMLVMLKEFHRDTGNASGRKELDSISNIVSRLIAANEKVMDAANISCDICLDQAADEIESCCGRLSLSLGNLLQNAIEAMHGGGSILIAGELGQEGYQLMVGDAGIGIKSNDQERIFEPFFTTKKEVEGIGLGLAAAYGAISSLGGQISFASEEGRGSIFSIILPLK